MARKKDTPPRPLGAGAAANAIENGFAIGRDGRMSVRTEIGPCTSCHEECVRYGPDGHPLCVPCRRAAGKAPVLTIETTGDVL
ncbi:hypothetical protein [Catellatospora sp. NPDC049609]|uniref:hypothetical protein n=1 Tax=Catellatospora sp. NPDC049609 TaxID=3155505 RepID=UPI003440D612